MIVDLSILTEDERKTLLKEAGDILKPVDHPDIHPDRKSSRLFYEIVIAEPDPLQQARIHKVASLRSK